LFPKIFLGKFELLPAIEIVSRWPNRDTIYGQDFSELVDRVTFLPNRDMILVVLQIFDRFKTQS